MELQSGGLVNAPYNPRRYLRIGASDSSGPFRRRFLYKIDIPAVTVTPVEARACVLVATRPILGTLPTSGRLY